jgi:hypothetical protein
MTFGGRLLANTLPAMSAGVTALAAAITKELTPDHIYSFGPQTPR